MSDPTLNRIIELTTNLSQVVLMAVRTLEENGVRVAEMKVDRNEDGTAKQVRVLVLE